MGICRTSSIHVGVSTCVIILWVFFRQFYCYNWCSFKVLLRGHYQMQASWSSGFYNLLDLPFWNIPWALIFTGFTGDISFGIGHPTVTYSLYLDQFIELAKSLHLLQKEVFDEVWKLHLSVSKDTYLEYSQKNMLLMFYFFHKEAVYVFIFHLCLW